MKTHLLKRLLGVKGSDKNKVHIGEIKMSEILLVNAGSTAVGSVVNDIKGEKNDIITFSTAYPICCEKDEKIAISRKIGHAFWRLIGWGEVLSGGKAN